MHNKVNKYNHYFSKFRKFYKEINLKIDIDKIERNIELIEDWNQFHDLESVKKWLKIKKKECKMSLKKIPINKCKDWVINPKTGNIHHNSGEFFEIFGLRVSIDSREVGKGGWDQPILSQVGLDGGLLGIVKQRFNGIPHYLIEAKAEPGNYQKLQLSPTLQATFSNLKKAHKGSKPRYSHYFEEPKKNNSNVLFNQWLSEDGGRLYLKRNRGMLVELDSGTIEEIPDNFIWLSLWQIKKLTSYNAVINPHIRGILFHI